jgi:hypothetical protein
LCYRYTIPQELLNDINGLDDHLGNYSRRDWTNHRFAGAPFYSFGPGLGKRGREGVFGRKGWPRSGPFA